LERLGSASDVAIRSATDYLAAVQLPRLLFGVVLARCPVENAGHTCATMNWALAFRELGWDVWITEHVTREECSDPDESGVSLQERFWRETALEFGFEGRECLLVDGEASELSAMRDFARGAQLFLNYSGQFRMFDLIPDSVPKAYLDLDPAFTQLWAESCGVDMNFAGHDLFLTIGMNVHGVSAKYPHAGQSWIPVRPPVAARSWRERLGVTGPEPLPGADAAWTTVGHWYGYHDLPWEGRIYGGKRHSFLEIQPLPGQLRWPVAVATDLQPEWGDDTAQFQNDGWQFVPTHEACRTVPAYLNFIRSSRGEIGIAKQGYLESQCGWVSDRSLCYLAMGRPVVLHDTGWPHQLPSNRGLIPFSGLQGAVAAIESVEREYEAHAAAAWQLAESTFSPEETLRPWLETLL